MQPHPITKPAPGQSQPWPSPSPKAARALATTQVRAKTLFADGYKIEPYPHQPAVYCVFRPENAPVPKGGVLWYDVDLANATCECEMFRIHGECKHFLAVVKAVAEALKLVMPMVPESTVKGFRSREDFEKAREADFS